MTTRDGQRVLETVCPNGRIRDREDIRAILLDAPIDIEGDASPTTEIRFADE